MSELLFEGYTVPAISYGIDGLYSLYHNQGKIYDVYMWYIIILCYHDNLMNMYMHVVKCIHACTYVMC